MHIKRIHEMIENLTECAESAIKNDQTHVGKYPISEVIDMIKDLSEAEYHSKITHAMEEEEKKEEEEEKYMLRQMKEEYGEDAGKRYYDEWRYANGRFAPKGRGTRRGYSVPVHYLTSIKSDRMSPEEYYRDMDRDMYNRMYYPQSTSATPSATENMSNNNTNSNSRTYSEGYNDGNRRGYDDGYNRGMSDGRMSSQRDTREGRSGISRRTYMETKQARMDNTPESKQAKMKELEKYMNELSSDMTEMIGDASNEEKTMLKQKLQTLSSKII